ncbi:MAG: hypothetical protein FJ271_27530 [Planctomycetes bacterium]|nr:hypothetical protein [Planctomycetota bacterium]
MRHKVCYILAFMFAPQEACAQVETGQEFKARVLALWNVTMQPINSARWDKRSEYYSARASKSLKANGVTVMRRAFKRDVGSLAFSQRDDRDAPDESKRAAARPTTLRIINPNYQAELSKSRRHGDGEWLMAEFAPSGRGFNEQMRQEIHLPWMAGAQMRLDLSLQDASFVFTRIDRQSQSGAGVVRAYFVHEVFTDEHNDKSIKKSGYIDFDTQHAYRPTGYRYDLSSSELKGVLWGRLEYEGEQSPPLLMLMVDQSEVRSVRKGLILGKEVHTFSNTKINSDVRDLEFRLPYYGLPEAHGTVWQDESRSYLWIAVAGLAALVAAFFSLRRARKRALVK